MTLKLKLRVYETAKLLGYTVRRGLHPFPCSPNGSSVGSAWALNKFDSSASDIDVLGSWDVKLHMEHTYGIVLGGRRLRH